MRSASGSQYVSHHTPRPISQEWIKKCKEVAKVGFSLLLPLSYLHGQKRYEEEIFRDLHFPLSRVYVFTRYALLGEPLREDGMYHTGMVAFAWFVWEKQTKSWWSDPRESAPPPRVYWIDNNEDVLSSKSDKGDKSGDELHQEP